jgi:hypothetical protein
VWHARQTQNTLHDGRFLCVTAAKYKLQGVQQCHIKRSHTHDLVSVARPAPQLMDSGAAETVTRHRVQYLLRAPHAAAQASVHSLHTRVGVCLR